MNPISEQLAKGTAGELLVQLRLLQFDVQAAPPLKDSGNDLIAIRGGAINAVQVKTTTGDCFDLSCLPERYNVAALVRLVGEGKILRLDQCSIFLLGRSEVKKRRYRLDELRQHGLGPGVVDRLFSAQPPPNQGIDPAAQKRSGGRCLGRWSEIKKQ
jgi:hypothetical protein